MEWKSESSLLVIILLSVVAYIDFFKEGMQSTGFITEDEIQ
jgi:hypothetical protein